MAIIANEIVVTMEKSVEPLDEMEVQIAGAKDTRTDDIMENVFRSTSCNSRNR